MIQSGCFNASQQSIATLDAQPKLGEQIITPKTTLGNKKGEPWLAFLIMPE
jgi:hypothetical protein